MPNVFMTNSLTKFLFLLIFTIAVSLPATTMANTAAQGAQASSGSESQADVYRSLANLIEDPDSRDKLLKELKDLSENADKQGTETSSAEKTKASEKKVDDSFAAAIAEKSQSVVQTMMSTLKGSWQALTSIWDGTDKTTKGWFSDLITVAIVAAATIASFIVFRLLARIIFRSTNQFALREHNTHALVIKVTAAIIATVVDIAVVALAWLAGYGVALLGIGQMGEIAVSETLFLNVFLAVELSKVVIRAIFASRNEGLRLLAISTETARYWSSFFSTIVSLVGYGTLFIVPFLAMSISDSLSQLANLFIVLFTVIFALSVIFRNKKTVTDQLIATAKHSHYGVNDVTLRVLAKTWHWFATAYFLVLGAGLLVNSEQALPVILFATVKTVVAILVGIGVIALLDMASGYGIRLPHVLNQHLANAEVRLNEQLPRVFKVFKVIVVLLIISTILDAWGIVNLGAWLASPVGMRVITSAISIFFIIAVAMLTWIILASWIEHRLNPEESGRMPSAREKTLLTIFRNAIAITIIVMTTMIVLSEIGINIGPLIAGAGVMGLAIGFGAQKLVQDVITGIFIQLENAINTGDVVTADGITGVAEKLTIRSLGLRDLSGTFHIIPFSSVGTVSNYMREFAYHVGEYGVAYREDTDEVIVKLREAFAELMSDDDNRSQILTEELEVHGVTALADSSVNVRVRIKTLPGSQWSIGRAYNRLVKRHLDAAGIEIPFPHLTLYFGEDKEGKAPAAPLRMVNEVEVKELFNDESDHQQHSDSHHEKAEKRSKSAKPNPTRKGDFDDAD
ncbi:mechanosensitive ion channel domain-containing protein [Methylophaga thalassica]|uniref:mechanosensitive ion channel domain-containing protein n=1 Tax=Methylophaga aminisulfidivorans TaxID=230105 RepID=UPI003A8E5DFD